MRIKKNSGDAAGWTVVRALASGTVFDADGAPNNVVKDEKYLIEGSYDKGMFEAVEKPVKVKEVRNGGTV